jgi:hypothetical protein
LQQPSFDINSLVTPLTDIEKLTEIETIDDNRKPKFKNKKSKRNPDNKYWKNKK